VTIHDLIHERYPKQYNPVDVKIYRKKFRHACEQSHRVIAISEQTKRDIVEFYKIPATKIEVCYQSCNPAFGITVSEDEKKAVRAKYQLPEKFFLHVGSIIERKNLLNVCKAVFILRNEIDIPLVVIGDGGKYKQTIKDFIRQNNLGSKIILLSENQAVITSAAFQSATDFPAIYQSATAMIYPSFFEGFGIPVLEALWSRLPVITSNVSSLPEAAGPAACYVNPQFAEEIAAAMEKIYREESFANELRNKGWEYAQHFTTRRSAEAVMKVYQSLDIADR
jgi:glycosyltransferase involved in cell wall biosynthesis